MTIKSVLLHLYGQGRDQSGRQRSAAAGVGDAPVWPVSASLCLVWCGVVWCGEMTIISSLTIIVRLRPAIAQAVLGVK